jgi:WD40 repeat protein
LSFDAWTAGRVAPAVVEVPIVAPKVGPQLESVSKRLFGELIHPAQAGSVHGVRFSPDGRRISAIDDASHVIAIWDVGSGRTVCTIDTRVDGRVSWEYSLSPDGTTTFTYGGKRDYERFQKDGKQLFRWSFDGEVRSWDLGTGQIKRTYKHQPPRNVLGMYLSPDGTKFVAIEEVPGTYEGRPPRAVTLWDVRSAKSLPVLEYGQSHSGAFTRDGRRFVVARGDDDSYVKAIQVFDASTGRERLTIPVTDKYAWVFLGDTSPDGRLVVGDYREFEAAKKWDKWRGAFKWWDIETGREVASFPMEKKDDFSSARFSPDGRTLAAAHWQGEQTTMRLYRADEKRLDKTVVLGTQTNEGRLLVRERVFSPDSKWLAVIAQRFPDNLGRDPDPRDLPQPRIHLIEVATGEIRETLVAPQSFMWSAAFSPDGRTLATGGQGKVLLWDVSNVTARR